METFFSWRCWLDLAKDVQLLPFKELSRYLKISGRCSVLVVRLRAAMVSRLLFSVLYSTLVCSIASERKAFHELYPILLSLKSSLSSFILTFTEPGIGFFFCFSIRFTASAKS